MISRQRYEITCHQYAESQEIMEAYSRGRKAEFEKRQADDYEWLAKKMWDRLGEEFYRKALEVCGKTEPECADCEWSPGDCEDCDV